VKVDSLACASEDWRMADYVVRRIQPSASSRFGIFKVAGQRPLFKQDFERAKDAFDFLRSKYGAPNVSVSRLHANWLVYLSPKASSRDS